MLSRTLVSITAALGLCTSTLARAEDVVVLANAVNALASTDPAAAARLAAAGAARRDLDNATRVLLGGLAYGNFKRAFEAKETGGDVADLCGLAAVMRLVAPLDDDADAAQVKLNKAAQAEATLERLKGPAWRSVCEPAGTREEAHDEPSNAAATAADETRVGQTEGPTVRPVQRLAVPRRSRARVGVGAGLLSAGAGLLAGAVAVLVARRSDEDRLAALADAQDMRPDHTLTARETADALAWDARYVRLENAGKVLGTLAGLSIVVGAIVLALPPRHRQAVRARLRPSGAGVHISF